MAGKGSHTSSSPRRKERRAQLWAAQQQRKTKRREANQAAASANKAKRAAGEVPAADRWKDVKERAAAARERRAQERQQSPWRKQVPHTRFDKRPAELRKLWRDFTAGRADVFS